MKVADILKTKGSQVFTISEDQTMLEAVRMLVDKNIGGLVVIDSRGATVGIVTERDVLKECNRHFGMLDQTRVSEAMTRRLLTGSPGDEIEAVQGMMTERRVRHLPIVEGERLIGLVSIGDVVKAVYKQAESENRDLKDLISGKYG
jgi:CBS domain-containing protein